MTHTPAAYAVTIDGRLYGYGETPREARKFAARQFFGGDWVLHMWKLDRLQLVPLDADEASATAECLDAEWLT